MVDKRLEIDIVANDRASRPIKNLQSTIIRFVGAVSASLAALRAVVFPINSAREFERVLRDVQKTTGFVNSEIEILGQELLDLSRTVDTSANDLGRIAAAAGQLGLGEAGGQAILSFTESIARAATTLDLTATQAATSFAKIGSIFNIPIQNTERLISTINELSNTTTATADQLLDVVRRVGTVAGSFEDVAALAAQAIQLGLSPETAGTSLVKIFSNFESRADQFAESFGITVGEFLGKGAVERWEFYLGELAKLGEEEAAKLINKLSGSGRIFALVDKQVQDAKNGFDIFRQAQENARTSFEEGTSAIEEYANISQSLDVQLKILRNNFAALGTEIGLKLVPTLIGSVQQLQEFLQTERARVFFNQLGEGLVTLIDLFEKFVNAVTSLPAGLLSDIFGAGFILAAVQAIRGAVRLIVGAFQGLQASLQTNAARVSGYFGAIAAAARASSSGVVSANQAIAASVAGSGQAVSRQITAYTGATAALGSYIDATQTATVANQGLAASAQRAQQASVGGAGAAAATSQAGPAARIAALNQELTLIAKKRTETEAIIAQSNRELANLKARAGVLARADRAQGQRNAVSQTSLKILTDQKIQQEQIIAGANRRLLSLQSQGVQLQAQLATVRQIAATTAAAAIQSDLADRRRIANFSLLNRLSLAFSAGLAGNATQAARLGGVLTTVAAGVGAVGRGLRILTPVVRIATVAFRALWAAIGGPIGLAITAVLFFGDELKAIYDKIVGNTRQAEASLTEIVRLEARARQGLINQQIADLERLQQTLRAGPRLDIDIEVGRLDIGGALEDQARFLEESGNNLNNYGRAAAGAAAQVGQLEAQVTALEQSNKDLASTFGDLNNTQAQFNAALNQYSQNEAIIERFNQQIRETTNLQEDLERGAQAAAEEIVQGLTVATSGVLDLQSQFVASRDELGRLELQAKQLGALDIQAKIGAEFDENSVNDLRAQLAAVFDDDAFLTIAPEQLLEAAQTAVFELENSIAEVRDRTVEFEKAASGAVEALTPTQRTFVDANKLLDARKEELTRLQETRDAAGEVTRIESERVAELRKTAPQILAQKFAYDEILKSLEKTKNAAEENRKAADGIFDNTASEARALNQSLEETRRNLADILRLREKERDLTRDIAQGEDTIQNIDEEIADLRKQVAESSDVYFRNITRAKIAELESRRGLEETLVFERQREQATLKFRDILEQLPGLTREARDAAAEGQVGPLQAIKDQIDGGIKDAEGILGELANLQDAEGNFLFREGELQEFENALSGATSDYTEALPNINESLRDAANAAERQIAEQIKTFNAQNAELLGDFKDLVNAFPGIADSLEVVRKAWEQTNKPLISAIESLGTQTQASLLGGRGVPENLGREIEDLSFDAGRGASRAIADSFGDPTLFGQAVQAGLGGANLEQYKSQIRENTRLAGQEGVDAVEIGEDENGFYGQMKNITQRAIDAALADAASGDVARRIVPPSAQVRQELRPQVAEADPTAATLAGVRQELTAALQPATADATVAAYSDEKVTEALKKAGGNTAAGFVEGVEKLGFVGGLVGGILGGLKDGLALLVEEAKQQLRIPGEAVPVPTFAGGGVISGPGTGTSDSILARLSSGEYVSDARTVGHFGSDFFAALKRAARGSNSVTNRMGRNIPRFAQGGLVSGAAGNNVAPVVLNIPGVGQFPVQARQSTIDDLSRSIQRESLKRGRK